LELVITYLKEGCVNPLAGARANKAVAILRFMVAGGYYYKRKVYNDGNFLDDEIRVDHNINKKRIFLNGERQNKQVVREWPYGEPWRTACLLISSIQQVVLNLVLSPGANQTMYFLYHSAWEESHYGTKGKGQTVLFSSSV
jgi:hypothetical protein